MAVTSLALASQGWGGLQMHPTLKALGMDQLSLGEPPSFSWKTFWDSIAAEAAALDIPQSYK